MSKKTLNKMIQRMSKTERLSNNSKENNRSKINQTRTLRMTEMLGKLNKTQSDYSKTTKQNVDRYANRRLPKHRNRNKKSRSNKKNRNNCRS